MTPLHLLGLSLIILAVIDAVFIFCMAARERRGTSTLTMNDTSMFTKGMIITMDHNQTKYKVVRIDSPTVITIRRK